MNPVEFQPTRWSLVLLAANGSVERLNELAATYWQPVHAFVCRKGLSSEDAEDVTQETLARLMVPENLKTADASKGRFRTYVRACADQAIARFLQNKLALKRNGNHTISWDGLEAGRQLELEPSVAASPDTVFDRAWSKMVVERALNRLRASYERLGKQDCFDALCPRLASGHERGQHAALAVALGITEANARVTWHRFKQAFVEALRAEVVQTLVNPDDLESELRHLLLSWYGTQVNGAGQSP